MEVPVRRTTKWERTGWRRPRLPASPELRRLCDRVEVAGLARRVGRGEWRRHVGRALWFPQFRHPRSRHRRGPALAADSRPSGLGRALLFSAGALGDRSPRRSDLGALPSADSMPSRSLPPVVKRRREPASAAVRMMICGDDRCRSRRCSDVRFRSAPPGAGAGSGTEWCRCGDPIARAATPYGKSPTPVASRWRARPPARPTWRSEPPSARSPRPDPQSGQSTRPGPCSCPSTRARTPCRRPVPVANQPSVTTGEAVPSTDASGG